MGVGVIAHYCNPSTQEAEAKDHEFKASLGYRGALVSSPFAPTKLGVAWENILLW
jgi:hypothetical protein